MNCSPAKDATAKEMKKNGQIHIWQITSKQVNSSLRDIWEGVWGNAGQGKQMGICYGCQPQGEHCEKRILSLWWSCVAINNTWKDHLTLAQMPRPEPISNYYLTFDICLLEINWFELNFSHSFHARGVSFIFTFLSYFTVLNLFFRLWALTFSNYIIFMTPVKCVIKYAIQQQEKEK